MATKPKVPADMPMKPGTPGVNPFAPKKPAPADAAAPQTKGCKNKDCLSPANCMGC